MIAVDVRADTVDSGKAPPSPELVGRRVGPYLLEERIGSGGMGTVYRALNVETQVRVAVKVLFPELAGSTEVRARFVREAEALAAVDHAGVVKAIGSGNDDELTWIAMELVDGESLEAVLARGVDVMSVPRWASAIAESLSAAHAVGIVHRDLKPANVLVARDGKIKLVDFGVARFEVADGTLTHTDAVLGTFNYMAPEQRLRARSVDHRADLFALGVIVYRALTGTLPIGAYEKPSALNRDVPRAYDAIVTRLLAADPAKRYPDARAVIAAFARLPRRRRVVRGSLGVGLLAASAAAVIAFWPKPAVVPEPVAQQAAPVVVEKVIAQQQADPLPNELPPRITQSNAEVMTKSEGENLRQKSDAQAFTPKSRKLASKTANAPPQKTEVDALPIKKTFEIEQAAPAQKSSSKPKS